MLFRSHELVRPAAHAAAHPARARGAHRQRLSGVRAPGRRGARRDLRGMGERATIPLAPETATGSVFGSSSVAEHPTVNRTVVGSTPTCRARSAPSPEGVFSCAVIRVVGRRDGVAAPASTAFTRARAPLICQPVYPVPAARGRCGRRRTWRLPGACVGKRIDTPRGACQHERHAQLELCSARPPAPGLGALDLWEVV